MSVEPGWRGLAIALCLGLMIASAHAVPGGADAEALVVTGTSGSSQYVELKPAFVANFGGPGSLRYLQAEIVLRVGGGEEGVNGVRRHMPYIRHVLVMLFSRQEDDAIATMEGRELLRREALEAVRQVLLAEESTHHVDDLLFNNFIVQR